MALLRSVRRGDRAAAHRVRELWILADTLDLDARPAVQRWLDDGLAARRGVVADGAGAAPPGGGTRPGQDEDGGEAPEPGGR